MLRASGASCEMVLYAPRSLNEPMGCADSHLMKMAGMPFGLGSWINGVRTAVPAMRAAAAWISGRVTKVDIGACSSIDHFDAILDAIQRGCP